MLSLAGHGNTPGGLISCAAAIAPPGSICRGAGGGGWSALPGKPFLINYREELSVAERRFDEWLGGAMARAAEICRRRGAGGASPDKERC